MAIRPELTPPDVRHHIDAFFGRGSLQYDADILRIVPVYQTMFEQLLDHLWVEPDAPWQLVELGCGTGNLTRLLLKAFPNAKLTVVDASQEMLDRTAEKLTPADSSRTELHAAYFNDFDVEPGSVDLIISSLALHHVPDDKKPDLYNRMFEWLKPGGKFRCADQCLTLPGEIGNAHNLTRWQEWATEKGADRATLDRWLEHIHTADHYASLANHFTWMQQAGFTETDCYWRVLFWAVFGAEKPA